MLLPLQILNLLETGAATATISGDFTEAQIVAGGQEITITLLNDTWIADITAQRQAIIDGLDSAQSELLGWNNEVRDKEVVTAVVRTSDTVVTITLTAATYDITANETITVTIPAAALTGAVELTGSPTIGVTAEVVVAEPEYHTIKFSLNTPNMTFASTQRKTTFSLSSGSVIMDMIEEPTVTEFILLTDGSFLLLTTGDKVIKSG